MVFDSCLQECSDPSVNCDTDEERKKYFKIQPNHTAPAGAKYSREAVQTQRKNDKVGLAVYFCGPLFYHPCPLFHAGYFPVREMSPQLCSNDPAWKHIPVAPVRSNSRSCIPRERLRSSVAMISSFTSSCIVKSKCSDITLT